MIDISDSFGILKIRMLFFIFYLAQKDIFRLTIRLFYSKQKILLSIKQCLGSI